MSLDNLYGPMAEPASPPKDVEKQYNPISLQQLSETTAPLLRAYMESAEQGLKLPQVIHDTAVLLWLIPEDEHVLFAAEEVIDKATGVFWSIRARDDRLPVPDDKIRIGHPSLLTNGEDKRARIGGEIIYAADEGRWYINNASGRFGLREHQTRENLEAAAGLFTNFGIHLIVDFIPPRIKEKQ
ncbi:hypothetical protein [Rhizobium leguminosarum]|uniref:hypothetical protein n=1 Tax=Rhizobium leguminosarum TaxID=384 RepID=UPI00103C1115|nr:hypothetical protein [Rhizobium leguminosarum]TBY49360.1 hypothetical protein E0H54_06515 [Rhizobium leguminosarum bv. viciae]